MNFRARYFHVSVGYCTNGFNYELLLIILNIEEINMRIDFSHPEITGTPDVSLKRRAPVLSSKIRQSHFTARNVSHRQPPTGSAATVRNFNSCAESQRLGELLIVRRCLSFIFLIREFGHSFSKWQRFQKITIIC